MSKRILAILVILAAVGWIVPIAAQPWPKLTDFPAPFVQDGKIDYDLDGINEVAIIVGETALAPDVMGATLIGAKIGTHLYYSHAKYPDIMAARGFQIHNAEVNLTEYYIYYTGRGVYTFIIPDYTLGYPCPPQVYTIPPALVDEFFILPEWQLAGGEDYALDALWIYYYNYTFDPCLCICKGVFSYRRGCCLYLNGEWPYDSRGYVRWYGQYPIPGLDPGAPDESAYILDYHWGFYFYDPTNIKVKGEAWTLPWLCGYYLRVTGIYVWPGAPLDLTNPNHYVSFTLEKPAGNVIDCWIQNVSATRFEAWLHNLTCVQLPMRVWIHVTKICPDANCIYVNVTSDPIPKHFGADTADWRARTDHRWSTFVHDPAFTDPNVGLLGVGPSGAFGSGAVWDVGFYKIEGVRYVESVPCVNSPYVGTGVGVGYNDGVFYYCLPPDWFCTGDIYRFDTFWYWNSDLYEVPWAPNAQWRKPWHWIWIEPGDWVGIPGWPSWCEAYYPVLGWDYWELNETKKFENEWIFANFPIADEECEEGAGKVAALYIVERRTTSISGTVICSYIWQLNPQGLRKYDYDMDDNTMDRVPCLYEISYPPYTWDSPYFVTYYSRIENIIGTDISGVYAGIFDRFFCEGEFTGTIKLSPENWSDITPESEKDIIFEGEDVFSFFHAPFIYVDTEPRIEEVKARCNLILVGGPLVNKLVAELNESGLLWISFVGNDKLKDWTGEEWDLAKVLEETGITEDMVPRLTSALGTVQYAKENPWAPDRYILVVAGTDRYGTYAASIALADPTKIIRSTATAWCDAGRTKPPAVIVVGIVIPVIPPPAITVPPGIVLVGLGTAGEVSLGGG